MSTASSMFRAFRHRNYVLFFSGQGLSLIGTWMQQLAEAWLAYRLTHSAFWLGVVGFSSQILTFLFAPVMGALADHANKRRLLILAQTAAMAQSLTLAALVFSHRITLTELIALSLFSGLVDALEIPTRQSFIIDVVEDPKDLPNAIALNSSLMNGARLIGPSIAGLIIAAAGEGWCFLINGISYLGIIIALFMMSIPPRVREKSKVSLAQSMRDGFSYAIETRPIAILLILLALVSLAGSSYAVLVPIFAAQVLHGGPHTLGFLMAGGGVGALTAALSLARRKNVLGLTRVIILGTTCFGTGLIIFSLSHHFTLSLLAVTVGGFGMMSSTASINTMLQTIVDPDKRGRIMSFFTMAFIGVAPIGNLMGGLLAQRIGAPMAVRLSGILCLLTMLIFTRFLPMFRKHIRPIYTRLGLIPEVANALQASTPTVTRSN